MAVESQPLPLVNTPRSYQEEAVDWFFNHTNGRVLIGDEMGLGKTGEIYMIWRRLGYPKPCLIVAGKNAMVAWLQQAKAWGCPQPTLIRGTAPQRKALWQKYGKGFVAVTRESLKRDIDSGAVNSMQFQFVISDECHKDSNRKTGNYKTLKRVAASARYVVMASGSIMRRGPQSLWGPLNIIDARNFRSYWQFLDKYCYIDKGGMFGWEILGPKNGEQMQKDLSHHMIMRWKKDVRKDMPSKTRDLDSNVLEMLPDQARMYNELSQDSMTALTTGDVSATPTVLAKIMRLRQLLVTPKLIDPGASYGAGIERIVELLDDATDQHMCVFTPFSTALPIVRQRLIEAGHQDQNIISLLGGLSIEELMHRIAIFKERRGIALCSIKYAESFDLQPATWGIFLGYEWDAWDNMQAEDRLHRGEIVDPVTLYYLRYRQGIDTELMLPALDTKINNVMSILRNYDKVRQLLQTKVKAEAWS